MAPSSSFYPSINLTAIACFPAIQNPPRKAPHEKKKKLLELEII